MAEGLGAPSSTSFRPEETCGRLNYGGKHMTAVEFIAAKRDGQEHTADDLSRFIAQSMSGEVADYQLAAWLMAAYIRGLAPAETSALTQAMVASGRAYPLGHFGPHSVDKHSTGGVGDKTSLVVAPLCASLGAIVPKMSGRGLGFTGGTLDKLESIPGFRTQLSPSEFEAALARVGTAIAAQSQDLVPADGKLYALRDVTATVDSIPLIASSIMSKKLALGCPAIVLDVKVGSGAFMRSLPEAEELAALMLDIGRDADRRVTALLSPMDSPLGLAVGNSVEVLEALETLRGQGPEDFTRHCCLVAAEMLALAGLHPSAEGALRVADDHLRSGAAESRFLAMVEAQGGDADALAAGRLPLAPLVADLYAEREGFVRGIDARMVGQAAAALGAGRQRKEDPVDHGAGILLRCQVGDRVAAGQPLATLRSSTQERLDAGLVQLAGAFALSDQSPEAMPTLHRVMRT
jgi:pyrimidine-nucleoside phosphorylase